MNSQRRRRYRNTRTKKSKKEKDTETAPEIQVVEDINCSPQGYVAKPFLYPRDPFLPVLKNLPKATKWIVEKTFQAPVPKEAKQEGAGGQEKKIKLPSFYYSASQNTKGLAKNTN